MTFSRSCFCVCSLLVLFTAGCAESKNGSPETGNDAKAATASKGTIGFSALTLTNPFFKTIAESLTEEAAKHGYEVVVVSGDQDVKKQSDQIDDFIIKGVKAIVLNPCDSRSIGQAIKKANDAGIPVFTNDIKYDGDEGVVECHIATDNLQGGRLAGEAMVKLLGASGGKVLIVDYPDVESCQLRTKGFHEIVDAHNAKDGAAQIEVVATLNGKGARDAGYAVTKDAIVGNGDLSAVFAINDPSALGAWTALKQADKVGQITIIGFDGQLEGKQAILEGKIYADPIQFPKQMGQVSVRNIMAYLDGKEFEQTTLIPTKIYKKADAENDPELQRGEAAPAEVPTEE